jgi:hypothetical protein
VSDKEKVAVLAGALEEIREATFAEFQLHWEPSQGPFNRKVHICPLCLRASTATHLKSKWAFIQATAARSLRAIEEEE